MRRFWRPAAMTVAALSAAAVIASGGCGSSRKNSSGNGGGGGGGGAAASQLNIQILSATVPAGAPPTVTFRATDAAGANIDLLSELGNAAAKTPPYLSNTPHFVLSQLEDDGTYTNLYESTVNGAPYPNGSGGTAQPALSSATQPNYDPPPTGPFPAAKLVKNADGSFTYTFSKAPTTDPSKIDATRTKTAAIYMERTVADTNASGGTRAYPASGTLDFAPGGGTAASYATVTDAQCNQCHGQLRAHDRRVGVALCATCHAGDRGTDYKDPDSGNSIDFRVMVHKIHMGASLPSVRNGTPYFIVGFRGTQANPNPNPAQDWSDVNFPQSVANCTKCHSGGANSDDWKNKPSRTTCSSCHDNISFTETSATVPACNQTLPGAKPPAACRHTGGPQTSDASCAGCHASTSTFAPIDKVHQDPAAVASASFQYQIVGATVGADRKPVVTFRVVNPAAGSRGFWFINATGGQPPDPQWTQGANSRLFLDVGWPPEEYDNHASGYVNGLNGGKPGPGQPIQINALTAATLTNAADGTYTATSPTALPPDVQAFTVVLEGHPATQYLQTTTWLRVSVPNDVKQFSATGAAQASTRRQVVDARNCNVCHQQVSAHGNNRTVQATGPIQNCVVCHNPSATDAEWITATSTDPEQPIDFKVLVHEIHASEIRQTDVKIHAFGGNTVTLPLGFPGQVGNCNLCHVNSSFQLPLSAAVHDTTTATSGTPPTATTTVNKTIAVCTSCHDQVRFDGSAGSTTCGPGVTGPCNHQGGPQTNDQFCATCHGPGTVADVARVHPIQSAP